MKKTIAFVLVLVCILTNTGCSIYNYDGWQSVSIDFCGMIKLPKEWSTYEKDGLLYVVDEHQTPVMIQSHSFAGFQEHDEGDVESNAFFEKVRCLKLLSSVGLSNSAVYGKVLVEKDSTQSEQFFLELWGEDASILLIIWDETIDENFVKQIAKSYVIAQ